MKSIRRIEIQKVIPSILIQSRERLSLMHKLVLCFCKSLQQTGGHIFKGGIDVFIRKVSKAFSLRFNHLLRLKACYFHFGTKEPRSSSSLNFVNNARIQTFIL